MIITRFKAGDVDEIELQDAQPPWSTFGSPEAAVVLEHKGGGFTARSGDRILACGGIINAAPDVGICWSLVARHAGRHFLALHRAAQRLIEVSGKRRLIANTECDFAAGCRWLEILGFKRELEALPEWGPDGRDHFIYVRSPQWP